MGVLPIRYIVSVASSAHFFQSTTVRRFFGEAIFVQSSPLIFFASFAASSDFPLAVGPVMTMSFFAALFCNFQKLLQGFLSQIALAALADGNFAGGGFFFSNYQEIGDFLKFHPFRNLKIKLDGRDGPLAILRIGYIDVYFGSVKSAVFFFDLIFYF